MIREGRVDRVTIRAFSTITDRETVAKLLLTARIYRLGVLITLEYLDRKVSMKECMFKIKQSVPNQRYAHACYERARETRQSARRLGKEVKQLRVRASLSLLTRPHHPFPCSCPRSSGA